MEISEILNWIFGGTSILGAITTFIFWSKTKRAKEAETVTAESNAKQSVSEAEQADIATQTQKIELGNKYIEDTLKMVELVKQALDKGEGNQERIIEKLDDHGKKLDKQDARMDSMESLMGNVVNYLNGGFQEYLNTKQDKE